MTAPVSELRLANLEDMLREGHSVFNDVVVRDLIAEVRRLRADARALRAVLDVANQWAAAEAVPMSEADDFEEAMFRVHQVLAETTYLTTGDDQ